MRKPLQVGDVVLIKPLGGVRGVIEEVIITRYSLECRGGGKSCTTVTYLVRSRVVTKVFRGRELEVCDE